jgi:hypothetical protein
MYLPQPAPKYVERGHKAAHAALYLSAAPASYGSRRRRRGERETRGEFEDK